MASDLALAGTVVERPRIEAPWSLPPGWVWVDVGKFGKLIRGVNFTKDKVSPFLQNGYCSLLRGNNIQNGKVDETELTNVDSACVSDEQILRPGDIVLTMSSGSTALIGKSAWIGPRHSRMTFGAFCACLRANNEEDARWLFWFLQTQYYRRRIANAAKGTNINNLKREHLENLPIPLAPHAERRRVIAQVDKMFAEIAEGEAALAMARKGLSNFRRGLLKAAVIGELTKDWRADNQGNETGRDLLTRVSRAAKTRARGLSRPLALDIDTLRELPKGWAWAKLGDLLEFVTSGSRGWKDY